VDLSTRHPRTATVVGATGNLGAAVVRAFAQAGWSIDERWTSPERPDVAALDAFDALPERVDAAVYCAGINVVAPATELSLEDWHRTLDINVTHAFRFAQAVHPRMTANGGTIVFISSIMATHPYPNRVAYAAAKGAIESMTRALATEWGHDRIRVHAVRLGHLEGLMKTTRTNPALLDAAREHAALKRLIPPTSVADYIRWLCDDAAAAVTGSVYEFDPGYVRNRWPLPRP
jgi:NAD(P)-dependent dehydrogenase (short-subunit alcohol dehydrogenase family)